MKPQEDHADPGSGLKTLVLEGSTGSEEELMVEPRNRKNPDQLIMMYLTGGW